MYTDIRNIREQATRKGKQEAVTWRAVWNCTSPGTGKQADHPSVQAELGPVRMCGGRWESVEQQQPAEEISITEWSQKLFTAAKHPWVSCMSPSAVTITYSGLYPALHHSPEQQHCQRKHCTGTQRHLMDKREPTCSSHRAGSENPKSHLSVLYLVLYPALSTLYLLAMLLIIMDWLGNLLKVTLSHTGLSICFS